MNLDSGDPYDSRTRLILQFYASAASGAAGLALAGMSLGPEGFLGVGTVAVLLGGWTALNLRRFLHAPLRTAPDQSAPRSGRDTPYRDFRFVSPPVSPEWRILFGLGAPLAVAHLVLLTLTVRDGYYAGWVGLTLCALGWWSCSMGVRLARSEASENWWRWARFTGSGTIWFTAVFWVWYPPQVSLVDWGRVAGMGAGVLVLSRFLRWVSFPRV